jgi:Polyketide cyclase / dehydrase and lipid transport
MASISVEVITRAATAAVWDAVRDVGALHTRLVPGFVVDTTIVPGGRRVTFGNGTVVEEPILDCNDETRRLVWSLVYGKSPITHYNSAVQVFDGDAGGSRIVWTTDVLPDAAAPGLRAVMQLGAIAMTQTLDLLAKPKEQT